MSCWYKIRRRLPAIFHTERIGELDDEIQFDMEQETLLRMDRGESLESARASARRDFGNVTLVQEDTRDTWGWIWLDRGLQDVRFALRVLRKSPLFAAVAIGSLAIGIGANAAVFSLIDAILFRAMPVRTPEQLRLVFWAGEPKLPMGNFAGYATRTRGIEAQSSFPFPVYRRLADCAPQLFALAGFAHAQLTVRARTESEYAAAFFVTGNLLQEVGIRPTLGRGLAPSDDHVGAPAVVALTYRYWERAFDRDPGVVGQTITINGRPVMIVGVLPRWFRGFEPGWNYDLMLPMASVASSGPIWYSLDRPDLWWVQAIARLRPGVTEEQAQAALTTAFRVVETNSPEAARRLGHLTWIPILLDGAAGTRQLREDAISPLMLMQGVAAMVLLITCANLANLLLARGMARSREIAVRLAIGAGRSRLLRQFATESLLTVAAGAALGLALAPPFARMVLRMAAGAEPLAIDIGLDRPVVLFTVAITLLTSLAFGLIPTVRTSRLELSLALKEGSPAALGGGLRGRRLIIAGQVAASMVLLTSAGLFARTLVKLSAVDPGYDPSRILTFTVDAASSGYQGPTAARVYEQIRARLETTPGIQATISSIPLIGESVGNAAIVLANDHGHMGEARADYVVVASHFFSTLGIPLLFGREPDGRDTAASPKVAVVNEAFVRAYSFARNAVGSRFRFAAHGAAQPAELIEVAGVCKDVRHSSLRYAVQPAIYLPLSQNPDGMGIATFEVRTPPPPLTFTSLVRRAVADLDRGLPIGDVRTQEDQIKQSFALERTFAVLTAAFGALAAALVVIGLYGVTACAVARRTPELGIRMALGARSWEVSWMVLRESLSMTAVGIATGIAGGLALTRLVRASLYGVAPSDPFSFLLAAALMLGVATTAAWIPARRAARTDAATVLRSQ